MHNEICRTLRVIDDQEYFIKFRRNWQNVNDLKHKGLNVRKVVGSGKLIEQFVRLEK